VFLFNTVHYLINIENANELIIVIKLLFVIKIIQ